MQGGESSRMLNGARAFVAVGCHDVFSFPCGCCVSKLFDFMMQGTCMHLLCCHVLAGIVRVSLNDFTCGKRTTFP